MKILLIKTFGISYCEKLKLSTLEYAESYHFSCTLYYTEKVESQYYRLKLSAKYTAETQYDVRKFLISMYNAVESNNFLQYNTCKVIEKLIAKCYFFTTLFNRNLVL